MVATTDLKLYKSTNNLGGNITADLIQTATPNNLFTNVPNNERVVGEDYYACFFLKNTHSTEAMEEFKLWLSDKSFPRDTEIKWAFEPNTGGGSESGYRWSPYGTFNGSGGGVISIPDDPSLDLRDFSCALWFRTTDINAPPEGEGMMITKGGWLSNDPNKNLNYGLWHSDANNLRGGFEETDGTDHILTTSSGPDINDGLWHHAVVTYNDSGASPGVRLYKDGVEIPESPHVTTTIPATSTNPLVIGDNSFSSTHLYFTGDLDEIYIWGRAISAAEVTALYEDNIANPTSLVYEEHFGPDDPEPEASVQTIPNKYTAPLNVTWNELGSEPSTPNIGKLNPGSAVGIWLWYHVNANAVSRIDDNETFSVKFNIPQGGTGSGGSGGSGGGTGGNPPPTNTDYKIAIVGDEGCEPETDDVIDLIQAQNYDYVVSVGDHAYESASCWTNRFDVLKPNFNSAYGNHEYSESGGTSPYKTFFGHSKTYFTFQFQNIFFLVIDDNDFEDSDAPSLSVGSTQHNFIKSELERVANDSTITWKIAILHHPWFGSGANHPANEGGQVGELHELFVNHKVSFVVTGHNHNWVRSHQVAYNESSPRDNPTIVDNSSPYSRNTAGLIHVVSGTGGHDSGSSLYDLPNSASFWAYRNNDHNGVWEIVASNNAQTLTCSFVEVGGDKFDTFTITA